MSLQFVPEGTVEIPEIELEDRVWLDATQTAIIVIDMQNDFVKPDGALVTPAALETVPRIQALLAEARAKGARVVYTQDSHIEDDPVRPEVGLLEVENRSPADAICPHDPWKSRSMNEQLKARKVNHE